MWRARFMLPVLTALATIAGMRLVSATPPDCTDCLRATYWSVAPDDWKLSGDAVFPETDRLRNIANVGFAFSGGGTRSATATLGQLRGVVKNGWLDHVRYVSAVSGGAWAAIPFTYSKRSLDDFLGVYEQPESLTPERVLKVANGRMALAVQESSLFTGSVREASAQLAKLYNDKHKSELLTHVLALAGKLRREPSRVNKTYARLLGKLFLDDVIEEGGAASDRLFAWDMAAAAEMSDTNPGKLDKFLVARDRRPFLIASGTIVSSRTDYAYPLLMPVEYTPLYVGVRQQFGGRFGGSYVWPWAYDPVGVGRVTPDPAIPARGAVQVGFDNDRHFTLADVAASTGAAPELGVILGASLPEPYKSKVQTAAMEFPAFRHFAVQSDQAPLLTEEIPHADGGTSDNLAVMPLLARHVANILVFINTETRYAEENDDLQSLFYRVGRPDASGDKTHNVVFDYQRLPQVLRGLAASRDRGEPQVYCDHGWDVVPNSHYNVRGYSGLNVCFFYNAAVPVWERLLPAPVLEILKGKAAAKEAKNLQDFPWFSTFGQNRPHLIQLTVAQVNLLSNFTAWIVSNDQVVKTVRANMPVLP